MVFYQYSDELIEDIYYNWKNKNYEKVLYLLEKSIRNFFDHTSIEEDPIFKLNQFVQERNQFIEKIAEKMLNLYEGIHEKEYCKRISKELLIVIYRIYKYKELIKLSNKKDAMRVLRDIIINSSYSDILLDFYHYLFTKWMVKQIRQNYTLSEKRKLLKLLWQKYIDLLRLSQFGIYRTSLYKSFIEQNKSYISKMYEKVLYLRDDSRVKVSNLLQILIDVMLEFNMIEDIKKLIEIFNGNVSFHPDLFIKIGKKSQNIDTLLYCAIKIKEVIKKYKYILNIDFNEACEILSEILEWTKEGINTGEFEQALIIQYLGIYEDIDITKEKAREKIQKLKEFVEKFNDKDIKNLKPIEIYNELLALKGFHKVDYDRIIADMPNGSKNLSEIDRICKKCGYFIFITDEEKVEEYETLANTYITKAIYLSVQDIRKKYLNQLNEADENDETLTNLINEINDMVIEKAKNLSGSIVEEAKQNLREKFGDRLWGKLEPKTRDFLITGEIVYLYSLKMGDFIDNKVESNQMTENIKFDYSAPTIPLTKALENEMFKYFIIEFKKYCDQTNKSVPNIIMKILNGRDYFALGKWVSHILTDEEYYDKAKFYFASKFNGETIKKHCRLKNKKNRRGEIIYKQGRPLKEIDFETFPFAENISELSKERNKVAHKEGISKEEAIKIRSYIIGIEPTTREDIVNFRQYSHKLLIELIRDVKN
ncbi:hypothetical protein [Caloranaerobacter ferrireducens]|uniref:hypothetical protein n=1 Tax=Caloranaerobacter ferrireducens TaxID=1323370 RepID=UPI00084D6A41|nr:hypothetical protein [Caloranaerobacter ferrireducens]